MIEVYFLIVLGGGMGLVKEEFPTKESCEEARDFANDRTGAFAKNVAKCITAVIKRP